MADETIKIVNATSLAEVVDLNNMASATGIRTVRLLAPDPNVYESILPFNPDVPGDTMLKQQDRWVSWGLWLRITPQTTMANLISKVNSVGNGFNTANRAFMVQRAGEASPRYFNIIPTRITPATGDEASAHQFNAQLMVVKWTFSVRTHPYAQGSSTPAWY